ncbi:MAG: S9 family peptidase, partial [Planctomycetaceae bacterium]
MAVATVARADEPVDQHQWLEEVLGEKPLAWVKERNAASTAELTANPLFPRLNERILKILDSTARIPLISKAGPFYYNFWRDAKNPRGLWRRTTLEEYRKAEPQWETVLDLDELGRQEQENWVWKGANFLQPGYDRVLLSLSRGGADATVVREFDPQAKQFVADGFQLPEAKTRISWRDRDSVFVGTNLGPGSLTDSGYPRTVREWRRGTPIADAPLVFQGEAGDVAVSGSRSHEPGYEHDWISRSVTFWTSELYLRRGGQLIQIDKPADANAVPDRDLLFLELRTAWEVGGQKHPAGALLAIDLEKFLAGDRQFDVLFTPTDRKSLAGFTTTRNHLLLNELDNVRNRIYQLTRSGGQWTRQELPGGPKVSSASIAAVDPDESDDYFLTVTDYLTPTSLAMVTVGQGPPQRLKENPHFFESQGLVVSQHEAVSADGTRVPYFQ